MVRLQGVNRHPLEFVGISIAITGRTNFLIRNLEEMDRHGIFNIRTPKHVFSQPAARDLQSLLAFLPRAPSVIQG